MSRILHPAMRSAGPERWKQPATRVVSTPTTTMKRRIRDFEPLMDERSERPSTMVASGERGRGRPHILSTDASDDKCDDGNQAGAEHGPSGGDAEDCPGTAPILAK